MMHSGQPRSDGNRGFSLIETLITLVVVSLAAAAVLTVFITGIQGSAHPLVLSQAAQLAQAEVEHAIDQRATGGFGAVPTGTALVCAMPMPGGFTCRRDVYYVDAANLNAPAGSPTAYKHVAVTITQAAIGSVTDETVIASY